VKLSLRQFNNGLSLVVIVLCLYVILAPLWPQVTYRVQSSPPLVEAVEKGDNKEAIPGQNTLVIPRMKLQQTIHEGGQWLLNKGVWHQTGTGAPDAGGNMVLSGHRFTYGGPAVFYHLDRVKTGDKIVVYWQKQKHEYQVRDVREVPPTASEVVAATEDPLLTIYTCTPLVTAKNRLVIQAIPLEGGQQ
jgi:LPXTG-site transpeptidase (sortase) family protein